MKSLRFIALAAVMTLAGLAAAQTHDHKVDSQTTQATSHKTDAQKSFAMLKTLAGAWQAHVTLSPAMDNIKEASLDVSLKVTSRGNAIVHELQAANTPIDPAKYDHPVTMLYLDNDKLTLIHYCDAGNRPRMVARPSADGKTVEFDFVDLSGANQYGHMHHAVFTFIDANHHIEDWTYMLPGDKPMHAHMELTRKMDSGSASGK